MIIPNETFFVNKPNNIDIIIDIIPMAANEANAVVEIPFAIVGDKYAINIITNVIDAATNWLSDKDDINIPIEIKQIPKR